MGEVVLFGTWISPFSHRVACVLKHKGVEYQYVEEDLHNKSQSLLKYNPVYKKIPVLLHGGKSVAESSVILEYIEETWPHKPLLPKDPYEKSQARFWIKFADDQTKSFFLLLKANGEELKKATEEAKETLKTIEELGLGEKTFFGGNEVGMTDFAFAWMAGLLEILSEVYGIKDFESEYFPRIHAWIQNFMKVPVFKESLGNRDAAINYFKQIRKRIIDSQGK